MYLLVEVDVVVVGLVVVEVLVAVLVAIVVRVVVVWVQGDVVVVVEIGGMA